MPQRIADTLVIITLRQADDGASDHLARGVMPA